jgi:hypothetical protein
MAGRILYKEVGIWGGIPKGRKAKEQAFMVGANIDSTRAKRKEEREAKKEGRAVIQRTNFKKQLLAYDQQITIMEHWCPTRQADRTASMKAAKLMTGLKRAILIPEATVCYMDALCEKTNGCPTIAGLRCHSLTIHDIREEGIGRGPLELFKGELKRIRHLTLTIPPTTVYLDGPKGWDSCGNPEDLSEPTQSLESVRLIFGVTPEDKEMEQLPHYPIVLAPLEKLLDFLSKFITFNQARSKSTFSRFRQHPQPRQIPRTTPNRNQETIQEIH